MVISVPSPMISMTVNQINKRPKIKRYVIWSGCFHVAIVKFFTDEKPATLHNIKIYHDSEPSSECRQNLVGEQHEPSPAKPPVLHIVNGRSDKEQKITKI